MTVILTKITALYALGSGPDVSVATLKCSVKLDCPFSIPKSLTSYFYPQTYIKGVFEEDSQEGLATWRNFFCIASKANNV